MYYSFGKKFFILLTLITANSTILVITPRLSASNSRDFRVANSYSSSQARQKQTTPPLSVLNRVQKAKELFNQGNQQYRQSQYGEAEKSLWTALKILNGGVKTQGFQAPRTHQKQINFWVFKISLPVGLPTKIFGNTSIPAIKGFNVNVPTNLDELYVSLTNNLNQQNNLDHVVNDISQTGIIHYNEKIAKIILDCASRQKDNCDEISQFHSQITPNKLHQNQDISNSVEDNHKIEIDILRLLEQTLVAQNQEKKIDLALQVAQRSRNLELFRTLPAVLYALNNEVVTNKKITDNNLYQLVSPKNISSETIKEISHKEKITLVYYSIVSKKEIFVWVVQPNKKIFLKKIKLSFLNQSLEKTAKDALQSVSLYVERGKQGKASIQAVRDLRLRSNISTAININNIDKFSVSEAKQKQNLQQLYQNLIAPIENLLPEDTDSHVVIIPQGPLFLVPFSVLQDRSGKYLIEKHTIRIAPNLHNLTQRHSSLKKIPAPDEILIIGNPTNHNASELPGAEREARSIGTLLRSSPLIGNQATKQAVKQQIFNKKIIHFATHGILDRQENSLYDDVILLINSSKQSTVVNRIVGLPSPNQENHKLWYNVWFDTDKNISQHIIRTNGSLPGSIVLADDSLTSQEILNSKLNADLVVLSACNTAQGITRDSIVLGLPLSLGIAGVSRVIVSLWAVPDTATARLMGEFYIAMRKQERETGRIDEAQALREAMLTIKKDEIKKYGYSDPINWAGFTLIDVSYQTKYSEGVETSE